MPLELNILKTQSYHDPISSYLILEVTGGGEGKGLVLRAKSSVSLSSPGGSGWGEGGEKWKEGVVAQPTSVLCA